jgi:hypothetical protein
MNNKLLVQEVCEELVKAKIAHEPMNSGHEAYAVILEELDEYWEHVKTNPRKLTEEARLRRLIEMRKELIQIAAMALRAIQDTLPEAK